MVFPLVSVLQLAAGCLCGRSVLSLDADAGVPWGSAAAPAATTATAATPKETFLGCNAIKIPLGGSCELRLQSILQMIFLKAPLKSLEKAA